MNIPILGKRFENGLRFIKPLKETVIKIKFFKLLLEVTKVNFPIILPSSIPNPYLYSKLLENDRLENCQRIRRYYV